MGTRRRTVVSSDCEKWDKVFNGLVKLLKNQEGQLETLLKERKILEDRIKMQHERWVSDIRLLEDHVSQMKKNLVEKEISLLLEASKSDLMKGLKQREASLYKLKLEQTEDELAGFRACFDYLSHDPEASFKADDNEKKGSVHSDRKTSSRKTLEAEVKSLKLENKNLAAEKSSEISALMKEKSFVWNQYNILESNLTSKLKSKEAEVNQANEKIAKVLACMEQLQSSNYKKDEMIERLKTKVIDMEADAKKWKEQISKLSHNMALLGKSKSDEATSLSKCSNARFKSSSLQIRSSGKDQSNVTVNKDKTDAALKDAEQGKRSLKRKPVEVITVSETPKLFTSTFKVPKLKFASFT